MFRLGFMALCIVGSWPISVRAAVEERAVIDYERGLWWTDALEGRYDHLGLHTPAVYRPREDWHNQKSFLMSPDTLKIDTLMYLQHLDLRSNEMPPLFPMAELLAFERDEVRQGRAPFFITATYSGKKRPVLCTLSLPGGAAAAVYGPSYVQAVNIRDDRYVKFWVKNFIRRAMRPLSDLPSWGICLDNSFYNYAAYVIIDEQGQYRQVRWDAPFPQNDAEWIDAAQWALHRVKDLAPDLVLIHNTLSSPLQDNGNYARVFDAIDGTYLEGFGYDGIYKFQSFGESRNEFWPYFSRLLPPDGPDAYKIQVFAAPADNLDETRQLFLAYLVLSGPNAFFGPGSAAGEWPWDSYASLKNKLGSPAAFTQSIQEAGKGPGYRMWSRRCEGGIVYLNFTGTRKSITLPSDGPYYGPDSKPVSEVVLDDGTATYVTTAVGGRVAKPSINPRRPGLVTGPLTITLETEPFTPADDAKIVYTLDGSEPDESSTKYTGPFKIHESCVVKARAFPSARDQRVSRLLLPSFTNFATYRLIEEEPTVEFHLASDCGSEFLEHDYPVVSLSHVSAHPVTVTYQATGGTATSGSDYVLPTRTVTVMPGEQHRSFYLHIVNDAESEPDETIVLSLSNPVNATLGEQTTYTYTIEDNDREPDLGPGLPEADWRDDFETGGFASGQWSLSGNVGWSVDFQEAHQGQYSARSGFIRDGESTTLSLSLDVPSNRIGFYRKVSSEWVWDSLIFSIDGVEKDRWSGEGDWAWCVYAISPGKHTFTWSYVKDDGGSSGSDCAWIDDIRCYSE